VEFFNKIEEQYIKINGITMHTIVVGDGVPLILLHGFPDFWYGWKNIIIGLKDDFKLIIPDMRGYNKSDKPIGVDNYKLDILVEDLKCLYETLGVDKFNIAGHDWGGLIAWVFAEKYPEYLNKLIILNAPHPKIFTDKILKDKKQQRASSYIFKFKSDDGLQFLTENNYQGLQLSVFGTVKRRNAFNKKDYEMYLKAWSQPGAISAGVNYYKAFEIPYRGSGIINVPTLVLWGMKDLYLLPILLDGLSEYVKDLKIIKVEDSSHWIMHDSPELVINNIKDFILKNR